MCLLRVPLLVHTSLRNKSCTQAPASSCYGAWKWPSVLWLKSLQASPFSQRCGSGSLCLLRNFRSSSSSLLLPSFPLLSQLFSCNKWHIRNPEGPLASLWPAPYKADHLSHLRSLPGTHCEEQASFEFVMISLLLTSKAPNYRWHNHAWLKVIFNLPPSGCSTIITSSWPALSSHDLYVG